MGVGPKRQSHHGGRRAHFQVGSWFANWKTLQESLSKFGKYAKDVHFAGRLFFREFSPPHFSYSVAHGMDFDSSVAVAPDEGPLAYGCQQGQGLGSNEFKLSRANKLMESFGFTVVPVYMTSSQRWDLHAGISKTGQRDCNHWAQPSPVIDVWNRVLLKFLREA